MEQVFFFFSHKLPPLPPTPLSIVNCELLGFFGEARGAGFHLTAVGLLRWCGSPAELWAVGCGLVLLNLHWDSAEALSGRSSALAGGCQAARVLELP